MPNRKTLAGLGLAAAATAALARRHLEVVPPPDSAYIRHAIERVTAHETIDYMVGADADTAAQHHLRLAAAAAGTWRPWLWAKVPGLQRQGTAFALIAIGAELRETRRSAQVQPHPVEVAVDRIMSAYSFDPEDRGIVTAVVLERGLPDPAVDATDDWDEAVVAMVGQWRRGGDSR